MKLSQFWFNGQAMEVRSVGLKSDFQRGRVVVNPMTNEKEFRSDVLLIGVKNIFSRRKFEEFQEKQKIKEIEKAEFNILRALEKIRSLAELLKLGISLNNEDLETLINLIKVGGELDLKKMEKKKSYEVYEYVKFRDEKDFFKFGMFIEETMTNLSEYTDKASDFRTAIGKGIQYMRKKSEEGNNI